MIAPEGSAPLTERWRLLRVDLSTRLRQGRIRVSAAVVPVLRASLAAALAVGLAGAALGHDYPFFAAVAAWVALGFSADVQPRRVLEVTVGITVGVGMGEAFAYAFGTGPVQIGVVLFVSALIARFLDSGQIATMQGGVQAVVVVGLPALAATSGPLGRWTDALIGGAVALVFALLFRGDPRKRPRALGRMVLGELSAMLSSIAVGVRTGDTRPLADALAQGRTTQGPIDRWRLSTASAQQTTALSPAWRRHRGEIAQLSRSCTLADRAIRNARVLARRSLAGAQDGHVLTPVAEPVAHLAEASRTLAAAIGSGRDPRVARHQLLLALELLRPQEYEGWRQQSLVILMRSLTADLLQVTGMTLAQARAQMPPD